MARILKKHTWAREFSRGSSYPWDEWFDGEIRELVRGTDFFTTVKSFRSTAYLAAKRVGVKLKSEITLSDGQESIIIQAVTAD